MRTGKPFHGPNRWPDGLPGFRCAMEAYYGALRRLGESLCRAFALDL